MENTKYKQVEWPGFYISYDTVTKIGYDFDKKELPLYETKSSKEIIDEYEELLKVGTEEAAARAYILRSFIENKRWKDQKGIFNVDMRAVMDETAINSHYTLDALSEYYKDFDKNKEGWLFVSVTGIDQEPGEW